MTILTLLLAFSFVCGFAFADPVMMAMKREEALDYGAIEGHLAVRLDAEPLVWHLAASGSWVAFVGDALVVEEFEAYVPRGGPGGQARRRLHLAGAAP